MDASFIPSYAKLVVVSHTEHFMSGNGKIFGWIPTVNELDFLAKYFNEVVHIAVLHPSEPKESTKRYSAPNIRFIPVPPFTGARFIEKFHILHSFPIIIQVLNKELSENAIFQFRAPTSIGLVLIPFLTVFHSKKKGWYKYAGSWVNKEIPLSYKIQKWMLEKWQNRPVTINGTWFNQPLHIKTFENPCLSANELPLFSELGLAKSWQKPYSGCFVGRMEDSKGVHRLVELLISDGIEKTIESFHFVGDGPKLADYKVQLKASKVKIIFHGFLGRKKTFAVYAQSNLFILPSNSEGFPKALAEAAAFGCVPIVSDVGSIGQFITSINGFLWPIDEINWILFFYSLDFHPEKLKIMSTKIMELARLFTFEAYLMKLRTHVFR